MLQTLREKTSGWVAFFILAAVSIPFAFFGINNYFTAQTETFVAKVGDTEISTDEFRARFEEWRQQQRRQMGENFDPAYFDQPLVKRQLLDRMVDEELLVQAADGAGTAATDALVRDAIAEVPAFQVEGKFNPDQYRLLLTTQNMSAQAFEQRVRRDLSMRELPGEIAATALVTEAALDRYLRLRDQTRDFRYVRIPAADASAQAEPTAEAVQAFYDLNKDEFMTAEQVALEFVELDAAAIPVEAQPDEAALRERFEEQRARFVEEEQRLASHILVKVAPDADADAQKAAQARAAKIAADVRAGADFAEVARTQSDDAGSRAQGGDLGWLQKGTTQPGFESALFALEAGQVSDPVRTDEGYHVIQLRELQAGQSKPFEEVRDELAQQFVEGERERIYTERSGRLIDQVFQDPTALEPAAEAIGVPVQRTELFTRGGGPGIAADPRVVRAAFSDPVLVDGNVSDPVEIGPNHIIVVKLGEHRPRAARPLDEVRPEIVARLRAEAATLAATTRADALYQRLAQGSTLAALAPELGTTASSASAVGRAAIDHDAALVAEVFRLARPAGAPRPGLVSLADGSHALVELTAVADGDPKAVDAAGRDSARLLLSQGAAGTEGLALIEALRKTIEVRVAEERM